MTGAIPDASFDAAAVVRALLAWYRKQARPLPWRHDRTPYRILVSEFMLQQTQVDTVIPYYERFLERFPTLDALARASEDDVLKLWEGLGYYRRARNLHRLAREVQERRNGQLPHRVEELRELPGVGEYTAGAVASIAFGHPVPAVDGNVQRVVARLLNVEEPVDRTSGRSRVREGARRLVAAAPPGQAGDLNQALMELGALTCTARSPQCPSCPVNDLCMAYRLGTVSERPVRQAPPRPVPVDVTVLVIVHGGSGSSWADRVRRGRVLLQRRPEDGLLGGLWGLPAVEGALRDGSGVQQGRGQQKTSESEESFLIACFPPGDEPGDAERLSGPLCFLEHVFSHRRWRMRAYGIAVPRGASPEDWRRRLAGWLGSEEEDLRWADAGERARLGIPRPFRRILERVERPGNDGSAG